MPNVWLTKIKYLTVLYSLFHILWANLSDLNMYMFYGPNAKHIKTDNMINLHKISTTFIALGFSSTNQFLSLACLNPNNCGSRQKFLHEWVQLLQNKIVECMRALFGVFRP